jgi:hypothetical protein
MQPPKIPSAQTCFLCLRNNLLPMCPVRTQLDLAPQLGLEPTTLRLTAQCSTIELHALFTRKNLLVPGSKRDSCRSGLRCIVSTTRNPISPAIRTHRVMADGGPTWAGFWSETASTATPQIAAA